MSICPSNAGDVSNRMDIIVTMTVWQKNFSLIQYPDGMRWGDAFAFLV